MTGRLCRRGAGVKRLPLQIGLKNDPKDPASLSQWSVVKMLDSKQWVLSQVVVGVAAAGVAAVRDRQVVLRA